MKQLFTIILLAVIFTSCESTTAKSDAPEAFNVDSVKAFLNHHNEEFSSAMVNGDSAAIAAGYHSEALIFGNNMPMLKGGAAMGSAMKIIPTMGVKQFKVSATNVYGDADMVVEEGVWEMRGDNIKDNGKFLALWKKENGQWKMYRDIWNSNIPLPTAAPAK
jgi:ketosteroid isomerase-like protein